MFCVITPIYVYVTAERNLSWQLVRNIFIEARWHNALRAFILLIAGFSYAFFFLHKMRIYRQAYADREIHLRRTAFENATLGTFRFVYLLVRVYFLLALCQSIVDKKQKRKCEETTAMYRPLGTVEASTRKVLNDLYSIYESTSFNSTLSMSVYM